MDRSWRATVLTSAAGLVTALASCSTDGPRSPSAEPAAHAPSICFRYATDEWAAIGEFQQLFFVDGEMIEGAIRVDLSISQTSHLLIGLATSVDPEEWLGGVGFDAGADPRVESVTFNATTC